MILKALYDYYQINRDILPAPGRMLQEIGFVIVIDEDGNFVRIEDNRSEDRKSATAFLVKKEPGRSSGVAPKCLYDNTSYVLEYSDLSQCKNEAEVAKAKAKSKKENEAFRTRINQLLEQNPNHRGLSALGRFYEHTTDEILENLERDTLWNEIKNLKKGYSWYSFRIVGDKEILAVQDELLDNHQGDAKNTHRCLITGLEEETATITTATMIPGSQAVAKLVAFQINSGYDSYGKSQCGNAPIGKSAEFAYSTALLHLLRKNSRNKFLIGDRSFLFWSSDKNETTKKMEDAMAELFGIESEESTGVSEDLEPIRSVFKSIWSGKIPSDSTSRFYVLGLSPNVARIAVSHWTESTVREFAGNMTAHFDDFEIADVRKEKKPYAGLRNILSNVTRGGKLSDVIPNLPESVANSIFRKLPYPATLFSACIRRIKAESDKGIYAGRAAILKAYLNRKYKYQNITPLKPMLDTDNTMAPYLCGRLFAVVDKMQQEANDIRTVRESYLNSASATPAIVFPRLLKLSNHYLPKLSRGRQIYFDTLTQEILSKLENGFPTRLNLDDQGRFFVGYYHQMADFFKGKSPKEETEETETAE